MDIFKEFGDVEISFDADRDYTNLDSMIKYSKKLEEKLKQVEEKIDELSWDGALNRAEEKLKQVESERLGAISSGANMMKLNIELNKKLQTLEKIAREGLNCSCSFMQVRPLYCRDCETKKKIDELVEDK